MKYKPYFSIIFTLFIFSAISSATVYENGENNSTSHWTAYNKHTIYDQNSSIEVIENRVDEDRKSRIIEFKGKEISYTYLLGAKEGVSAWNNTEESILSWKMKMKEPYQITLYVHTKKGLRYIYFSPSKNSRNFNNSAYIHVNLKKTSINYLWQTFSFDLATIIKNSDIENELLSVNGLTIQGLGAIDDIQLTSNKDDFITTWKITQSKKLQIETDNKLLYNFDIIWGDGSMDKNITQSITHHYKNSGLYSINIRGEYPHIYNLCSKKQHLITINQWGSQPWKSMKESFKDCQEFSSIYDTNPPDLTHVKNMYRMFYHADIFNEKLSDWNLSSVTDTSSMFYHADNFNQNIGNWDVSSVTDMSFMFSFCSKFNQDISRWDVSSVEDMRLMFWSAKMFNQDISDWNVSSLKTMRGIFNDATNFNQDITKWDTSSVTDTSNKAFKERLIPQNASVLTDIYNNLEQINGINEIP